MFCDYTQGSGSGHIDEYINKDEKYILSKYCTLHIFLLPHKLNLHELCIAMRWGLHPVRLEVHKQCIMTEEESETKREGGTGQKIIQKYNAHL